MNVDIIEKPKKNISEDIKVGSSTDIVNLKDVQEIRNAIREHLLFIGLDNRNNIRNNITKQKPSYSHFKP